MVWTRVRGMTHVRRGRRDNFCVFAVIVLYVWNYIFRPHVASQHSGLIFM